MTCRIHGRCCRTTWGWDPEHTDSARPYTLDELARRSDGPHRYAYASPEEYVLAWYTWRALRRDARLNAEEARVHWELVEERILGRAIFI